jgi:transposase
MCLNLPGGSVEARRVGFIVPFEAARRAPNKRGSVGLGGPTAAAARILEPHVGRAVVVSPRRLGALAARAKTDRIDARTLARLLAAGVLSEVWTPDEATRALRERVAVHIVLRVRPKKGVHKRGGLIAGADMDPLATDGSQWNRSSMALPCAHWE